MKRAEHDVIVVGSGPNGLTAAARLARAGLGVLVLEQSQHIGGGAVTRPLIQADTRHDICSAVHPMGIASPAFTTLDLTAHGLEWLHPPIPLAHPLDGGDALALHRSVDDTAATLGADGDHYRRLVSGLVPRWDDVLAGFLGPLVRMPLHPIALTRFGAPGLLPATTLGRRWFPAGRGAALLAGIAAHSCIPLSHPLTTALGLALGVTAHTHGWPVARGGSQAIADALVSVIRSCGGDVQTGVHVRSLSDVPPARAVLLDVTPRQFVDIAGNRLRGSDARPYRRWRYGAGVFKVDYILRAPVPWAADACRQAGTIHVGGTMAEIAASESAAAAGGTHDRPYVLVAQPTIVDPSRAPDGTHVLWAYSHVPHGSDGDHLGALERQIERFAPGFADVIEARCVRRPADLERDNPNEVGGDIAGGALDGTQMLIRPRAALDPYRTPIDGVWLCSASTPPGAGVHGMCGWWAAGSALKALGRRP